MGTSLLSYLSTIIDFRGKLGKRHSLEFSLLIIIMSTMSGYLGIRAMGDFAKRNKKELIKHLKPKKRRVPSYSTLRRVLMGLDFEELTRVFYEWAKNFVAIGENEWLSVDGKSIKATLSNYDKHYQDFISLVTVFSQKRKMALAQASYHNKKVTEITIVQELMQSLDLEGKIITMDALHCQKKLSKQYYRKKEIM